MQRVPVNQPLTQAPQQPPQNMDMQQQNDMRQPALPVKPPMMHNPNAQNRGAMGGGPPPMRQPQMFAAPPMPMGGQPQKVAS